MTIDDHKVRFDGLDLAGIRGFVDDHHPEGVHLDFKTVKGAGLKSTDDRKNLAKAISGFANSNGGLVVWGIMAAKGEGEVDCAQSLCPVPDAALLHSRLNELTSDMVSPLVDGVEHKAIPEADGKQGYAVTLVPRSESGPHMAYDHRYYKRSGESFVMLEHFDVADMFGRRAHPRLELTARVAQWGTTNKGGHPTVLFHIICSLANMGRGSAHAPYVSVRIHDPYTISPYGADGNMNDGLPRIPSQSESRAWGGNADIVIHPGTTRDVFCLNGEVAAGLGIAYDLVVDYEVAADGAQLRLDTLSLKGSDIVRALRR